MRGSVAALCGSVGWMQWQRSVKEVTVIREELLLLDECVGVQKQ